MHHRGREQPEFELLDTGIFDEDRYFDVTVEYAKATPTDILIRLTIANRAPQAAEIHVLPTLWFRNTWSWGEIDEEATARPASATHDDNALLCGARDLGTYYLAYESLARAARMPFHRERHQSSRGSSESQSRALTSRTPFMKRSFRADAKR